MTKAGSIVVPAFALLLAACGSELPRAVSFFEENNEERAKVLADCQAGEHRGEECGNANEAERLVAEARRSNDRRRQIESWITR